MSEREQRKRKNQVELIQDEINKRRHIDFEVTGKKQVELFKHIEHINPDFANAIGFKEEDMPLKVQYKRLDKLENYHGLLIADRHPKYGLHTMLVIKENNELYAFDPNDYKDNYMNTKRTFFQWFFTNYRIQKNIKIYNVMAFRTKCMQANFSDGACSVIGSNLLTMYYKVNEVLGRVGKLRSPGLDKLYEYMEKRKKVL